MTLDFRMQHPCQPWLPSSIWGLSTPGEQMGMATLDHTMLTMGLAAPDETISADNLLQQVQTMSRERPEAIHDYPHQWLPHQGPRGPCVALIVRLELCGS